MRAISSTDQIFVPKKELKELSRPMRAYEEMRQRRPDIVDSPETLAELARFQGIPAAFLDLCLPWRPTPEFPMLVRMGA